MSIGKNIKRLRESNNMTQRELATIAGVTDKAVSMWESDQRDPRMGAISKIAEYFGIEKSDIIDDPNPYKDYSEILTVPVFEKIEYKNGAIAVDNVLSFCSFSTMNLPQGEYVCLKISDDSMFPKFEPGDIAIINLKDYAEQGSYALVSVNEGVAVIRHVSINGPNVVFFCENPYYKKQIFNRTGDNIKFLGIVERIIRDIRK